MSTSIAISMLGSCLSGTVMRMNMRPTCTPNTDRGTRYIPVHPVLEIAVVSRI